MSSSRLFLIDAHALCYRSYFAIKGLATSKGQATNAVYGFISTLKKILRDYEPTHMAVCFDVKARTHRQEKFEEYKIHRPKMPDDLITQLPLIKEVVEAYNLPIFELGGFEADDIIATIVENIKKDNLEVVIVSDDKDMFQLVGDKVKVFSARKDKIFDAQEIEEMLGFKPTTIPDYIGLAGDKSDNIPGVNGIGQVSARKLINQFGSLERIFDNIDEVTPARVSEKLRDQKEAAFFSKELALLETGAPIHIAVEDMQVTQPDGERLLKIFNDLEFRKFVSELAGQQSVQAQEWTVVNVSSKKEAEKLVGAVVAAGRFAFAIETVDQDDMNAARMAISLGGEEVFCVAKDCWAFLKEIFEGEEILKIAYDIKMLRKILCRNGCDVKGKVFDCLLAGYLLMPSKAVNDPGALAWEYLKISLSETNRLFQEVNAFFQLHAPMVAALKAKDLLSLFDDIEMPLAHVLFCMEEEGVKVDRKLLGQLSSSCDEKIAQLTQELFSLAGEEFNLNSPKQLSHILFEKLGLPVIKKTKTGYSTNEEVLNRLAPKHPLPSLVLEYRQLAKLKSTYIDALPKMISDATGRIHALFNQTGTDTGRLSSSNPNLQNIPIRTELGRQIRKAFISSGKDREIISADYSQIELRVLAHLSGDENLVRAFQEDQDIHDFTAALIFNVDEKDVTPQMRTSAKRVNFGITYGMSAFGLAKDLGVPQPQAQDFIDRYFLRYPGVKAFMDQEIAKCEEKGYVVTLLNRRRYIPEINNSNMSIRQFAQRQAINTPVQGSAADLIKLAMIRVYNEIEKQGLDARMIISVHDEIVFDVPRAEERAVVAIVREHMENAIELSVPIKATIKKGPNWLEMERV
ncbi:MAG: DNA polymerase I [Candidatus Omnitrophica bacterium]|nr:DNA polymerase I [Candidatus Omnitrophota bacterium]